MTYSLYEQICLSKSGVESETLALLTQFNPLLERYAHKLRYDDATQDLTLAFIILLKKFPFEKEFQSDGQVVNYLVRSIYHHYIKLSKKKTNIDRHEIELNEAIDPPDHRTLEKDDHILLQSLFTTLTAKEASILLGHYIQGYSIQELAQSFGVTRQAVNKAKNVALKKLRENGCDILPQK